MGGELDGDEAAAGRLGGDGDELGANWDRAQRPEPLVATEPLR